MGSTLEITRPMPPAELFADVEGLFIPAPDVLAWLKASFLTQSSKLYNVEHDHLNSATIGVLWTNLDNGRNMKRIVAQAEVPFPQGGRWQKERSLFQLRQWFGAVPDFLLTFDANYAAGTSDLGWCATVEHELYHCAQRMDQYGFPAFTKEGKPRFGIKGHSVEEHTGVIRRYGIAGGAGETQEFVKAAMSEPEIGYADIAGVCGTCLSR